MQMNHFKNNTLAPGNNKGFTLVELIITLAIASILMSLAMPSFVSTIKNNSMTTQANQFIVALNLARSEAIKRRANIDVVATNPSASNEWAGGWTVAVNGGATIKVFSAFESGSTLDSVGNSDTFQYQPSGRANITDSYRLCDDRVGETGREITISTTGRVSVSQYSCS